MYISGNFAKLFLVTGMLDLTENFYCEWTGGVQVIQYQQFNGGLHDE